MNRTLPVLLAAALIVAVPARADDTAPPVELEPLVVTPPESSLDDTLDLLRVLVAESTPCLGCDAALRARPAPAALTLLGYLLLPGEPPQVDEATRLAREIKLQTAPELDYLRR